MSSTYVWQIQQRRGLAWFPLHEGRPFERAYNEELEPQEFAEKLLAGAELGDGGLHRALVWHEPAGSPTAARMIALEVLLAILHETPGADRDAIMDSDAWRRAPGWTSPPTATTITRAANELGDRIDRSAGWRLTATGAALGARAAALLTQQAVVAYGGELHRAPDAIVYWPAGSYDPTTGEVRS